MKPREFAKGIFTVGAVDWDRRLFDSLIPLPDGTSYNAYLIKGSDKTVKVKYSPNSTSEWVWAKKLDSSTITYLKSPDITDLGQMASGITNRLEIRVTVDENEPTQDSFDFKEFALFSIDGMDISKIFFINYVSHPVITKTKDMTRKLTIDLAFLAKK